MFDNLTRENILLYAIKSYQSPNMVLSEIDEDLKLFSYVRRLFRRYLVNGDLKENLLLNHIIVILNLWGPVAGVRLLFYHTLDEHYPILKPFLVLLQVMPERVSSIKGNVILSSDIPLDSLVVERLRAI